MLLCETAVCVCVCVWGSSPFGPRLLLYFLTSLCGAHQPCLGLCLRLASVRVGVVRLRDPVLFHEITTVYCSRAFPSPLISYCSICSCLKKDMEDFPGGPVVGRLPASERDTGSISGLESSHMLWSNKAQEPQLLSLCSRACVLHLLKPECHDYWTPP